MNLEEGRKQIDEIDGLIVTLLNRRATVARQIGEIKMRAGLPVVDHKREDIVLRRIVHQSAGRIGDEALTRIYRVILGESRRIQNHVAAELAALGELSK